MMNSVPGHLVTCSEIQGLLPFRDVATEVSHEEWGVYGDVMLEH